MREKFFFVTGIDTNIGKTLSGLLFLLALQGKGLHAGYMKPIETGVAIKEDGDKNYLDGLYVKERAVLLDSLEEITPITFSMPLSPYAASILENKQVSIEEALFRFHELSKKYEYIVMEGAGGMLVPIKKGQYIIDIAEYTGAAIVLVTKPGLGMLNQTLLNIEYAKSRGLNVAGIIINDAHGEKDESVSTNLKVLADFTEVPVIGNIPYMEGFGSIKDKAAFLDLASRYIDIEKILI